MNAEQAGWTTDEDGTKFFRHNGWEVKVWGPQWTWERMEVTTPSKSHNVWIYDDFVSIEVESHRGYESESIDIPWCVLEAIVDAKRMVNESKQG